MLKLGLCGQQLSVRILAETLAAVSLKQVTLPLWPQFAPLLNGCDDASYSQGVGGWETSSAESRHAVDAQPTAAVTSIILDQVIDVWAEGSGSSEEGEAGFGPGGGGGGEGFR